MRRHSSIDRIPERDLENNAPEFKTKSDSNKKGKEKIIKEIIIDFAANSNLHGLRYIGEKQRTKVEKVFWLFMFLSCVAYCAYLIHKVWMKWDESPVMVSFAEHLTPVWQIPYPAVTICFQIKANPKIFNFTEYHYRYSNDITRANLTEEEKYTFEDFSMICDYAGLSADGRNFSNGKNTVKNIYNISATFDDFGNSCMWKEQTPCKNLFSPIITEEGLCQTFNTLGPEQLFRIENLHKDYEYMTNKNSHPEQSWTLERGYPPSTPLDTYPYRGTGNGGSDSLQVLIGTFDFYQDWICKQIQGFKIFLHSPAELPLVSRHYITIPLSQGVMIAVKPKMIRTTEGLLAYSFLRRQCYFSNERYLQYFKIYTQTNCEIECSTNFTHARCGCVHFGLPHGPGMKTCGIGSLKCLFKARTELVKLKIESSLGVKTSDNDTLGEARAVAAQCKCLPACTSIEYEAETSQADVDLKAILKAHNSTFNNFRIFISVATIYMKEAQFITMRRSELFGLVDFLANCGGLLGLFMGFSVLSVAEIIYFLTLRWWCLFRKNQRIQKIKNQHIQKNEPYHINLT